MSWKNCWDCPIPLWWVFAYFAISAIAAAMGGALQRRRREPYMTLGGLVVILSFLWSVLSTSVIPRWGILRSENRFDVLPDPVAWTILIALDVVVVGCFLFVRGLSPLGRAAS